jgi:DNA-binding transcriptional ArsR family regulator
VSSFEQFAALGNPIRLAVVEWLASENEPKTPSEIMAYLSREHTIKQSGVSAHLATLKQAGVLSCVKVGKFVYYMVHEEVIAKAAASLQALLKKPAAGPFTVEWASSGGTGLEHKTFETLDLAVGFRDKLNNPQSCIYDVDGNEIVNEETDNEAD